MWLERWLKSPIWLKYLCLGALGGVTLLIMERLLVHPRQAALRDALVQNQQSAGKSQALRHRVVALVTSLREAKPLFDAGELPHFSVMGLAQRSGAKLDKWQPEHNEGSLEMLLAWEKLPLFFTHLSGYRAVSPQGFNVEPAGGMLRLTIALDFNDEP